MIIGRWRALFAGVPLAFILFQGIEDFTFDLWVALGLAVLLGWLLRDG